MRIGSLGILPLGPKAIAASAAVSGVYLMVAPRWSLSVVALIAVLSLSAAWMAGRPLPRLAKPTTMAIAGAVVLYLAASGASGEDPVVAFRTLLTLAALVAICRKAAIACDIIDLASLSAAGRGLTIALAIGTAFLLINVLTDHWLLKQAINWLAFLAPRSVKHLRMENGVVTHIQAHFLNRNVLALALVAWPALLLTRLCWTGTIKRPLLAATGAAVAAAILLSEHDSSKVALLLSLTAVGVFAVSIRSAYGLLALGWLVATLLVVPIVKLAYAGHLHQAGWLPHSARDRVVIWELSARQVARAPVLGLGLASAKSHGVQHREDEPDKLTRRFQHTHNVFLQIWVELGLVGACLLAGLGIALLWRISQCVPAAQPFHLATFAAVSGGAAFSYGAWQPWFMGCIALAALLSIMADALVRRAGISR